MKRIFELMDSPEKFNVKIQTKNEFNAEFYIDDLTYVFLTEYYNESWEMQFGIESTGPVADYAMDITGSGNEFKVFATVASILSYFIKEYNPKVFVFSAQEKSRIKLYNIFSEKISKAFGYRYTANFDDSGMIYKFSKEDK